MNADDPASQDEQFATHLAAWDEALAEGRTPQDSAAGAPAELQERLERAQAGVELLRRLWPARPAAGGAGPDLPARFGRFEVRRELGRGGYGVVFLAYDPQLRREVALKVPRADALLTPELRARFRQEAHAAAGLDHPNVVPVYEAGEVGPVCYIASAYCPGPSLADWLRQGRKRPPFSAAAALVAAVADGVQHAHDRGVLHRDLKPANILLQGLGIGDQGSGADPAGAPGLLIPDLQSPIPKITDFGLAKLAGDGAARTPTGAVLGTPSYMAPEQARGRGEALGPAVDVYALGATLYEMLTGRPPFEGDTPLHTLAQVCSQEPVAPSRLRPQLPCDLETICLKCLRKEPANRYAGAGALADDLRRLLGGKPIHARPVGVAERAGKWARRRPAVAALLAVVVLLLTGGFTAVTVLWRQAEGAYEAEAKALQNESEQRRQAEASLAAKNVALAHSYWMALDLPRACQALEESPPPYRDREWHRVWRLCHAELLAFHGHTMMVWDTEFSPDGRRVASADGSGIVKLWDAASGQEILTLGAPSPENGHLALVFHPDGTRVTRVAAILPPPKAGDSTRLGGESTRVDTWDLGTGRVSQLPGLLPSPREHFVIIAVSADGSVAAASTVKRVRIWKTATGQELPPVQQDWAYVALSADGRLLVGSTYRGAVRVWDTATGNLLLTLGGAAYSCNCVAISPDGRCIASATKPNATPGSPTFNGEVVVWDAQTGEKLWALRAAHLETIRSLAFSPDGRRLAVASGGWANTVVLWDLTTGRELLTFRGHTHPITSLAFSPDGARVVSGSEDHTVRIWDARPLEE
jgi:WD40 repeat protein